MRWHQERLLILGIESTNARVKSFAVLIMFGIVGLGAWQVCFNLMYFARYGVLISI